MKSPLTSLVLLTGLTATTAFVPQPILHKQSLVQHPHNIHQHQQPQPSTALYASSAKNKKTSRASWAASRGIATASSSDGSSSDNAPKLIIAGAPASGKGTQCEIIKEKYGVVHLSTGDMLRAAVAAETEVGMLAKDYMDSGKLVPDEVIIGVVS